MGRLPAAFLVLLFIYCDDTTLDPDPIIEEEPDTVAWIETQHTIYFSNMPTDSLAIIADTKVKGREINDSNWVFRDSVLVLENFNNSQRNNQLVAFTPFRRPLLLADIDWESPIDTTLAFEEMLTLPVTAWIIYVGNTSVEYQTQRLLKAFEECNFIYAHEGTGIQFDFQIEDVSSKSGAEDHYDITNGGDMQAVVDWISPNGDRINIFFTRTTNESPQGAWTSYHIQGLRNYIAHGMWAVDGGIIAHELGHNLTLTHLGSELISIHNVMLDIDSQLRVHFSEGQIYNMWWNSYTALNTIYELYVPEYDPMSEYLDAWDDLQPYFHYFPDNDSIKAISSEIQMFGN